jgi:ABC-type nitrate/sulfonate/bicarbonate transport system substrate-binding protein
MKIGFIDLVDAAPLIAAYENGCFADEGLDVHLEKQIGWGNIRDRLTFGQLDAAHALQGMPLFSQLNRDWFVEPLVAVMNLGAGGNAITLSKRLIDAGVRSSVSLANYLKSDPRHEVMVFGHVFGCSMHHYLLRDWLSSGGIDPDRDVRLRIFPPNQLAQRMAEGYVAGFCVGEPWNSQAAQVGAGKLICPTTDLLANHPEKILAVSHRWLTANEPLLVPMIRAILRGCMYCNDARNQSDLARMLSSPVYLNMPAVLLEQSLAIESMNGRRFRSFDPELSFPHESHSVWMAKKMIRWRQIPSGTDVNAIASRCSSANAYRIAAESLGIACPAELKTTHVA